MVAQFILLNFAHPKYCYMVSELDNLITLILNEASGMDMEENINSLFEDRMNNAKLQRRDTASDWRERFGIVSRIISKPERKDAKKWVEQIENNIFKVIEVAPFGASSFSDGYRMEAIVKIIRKKNKIFVRPVVKNLIMWSEDNPERDYYIQKEWSSAADIDKHVYAKKLFEYLITNK